MAISFIGERKLEYSKKTTELLKVCYNIKILTNSNQQTQSYEFTSHIAAFLSVVLITEMLEICIQTSFDQNVQLIFKKKSYLPVVYGTPP
jgi:L-arabinose isomerase